VISTILIHSLDNEILKVDSDIYFGFIASGGLRYRPRANVIQHAHRDGSGRPGQTIPVSYYNPCKHDDHQTYICNSYIESIALR